MWGVKRRDARRAERGDSNEELPRRDGERCEHARGQDDGNPTFGGEGKCAFHRDDAKHLRPKLSDLVARCADCNRIALGDLSRTLQNLLLSGLIFLLADEFVVAKLLEAAKSLIERQLFA